jgi:hypothetical protein
MGWLIGGIIALYLVARSNATAAICIAPTVGGTVPVTPVQSTIGPVHVSPSQSLVCHATAVGCPTLPSPSTASEGATGGAQPVNSLLPVQLANCNHIIVGTEPIPVNPPVFHCDHIVCPAGPFPIPVKAPIFMPVTSSVQPVQPAKPVSLPFSRGTTSFQGILDGAVPDDASQEF